MIFDGPDKFPESSIEYTRFKHFPLRERFAKLREQEQILQRFLDATIKKFPEEFVKVKNTVLNPDIYSWVRALMHLEFVEGELSWMAHNIADEFKDNEPYQPVRRRRSKKQSKEPKESKQIPLWEVMQTEVFY